MAYRYPTIKVDGKTKLKHRHVAEETLGRALLPDEQVHHKDDDPFNADPKNLQVLKDTEHRKIHADRRLVHPRTKNCTVYGSEFTPHRSKRKRAKTCSPACANIQRSRSEIVTKGQNNE